MLETFEYKAWASPSGKLHLFLPDQEHADNHHPELADDPEFQRDPRGKYYTRFDTIAKAQSRGYVRLGHWERGNSGPSMIVHYDHSHPASRQTAIKAVIQLKPDPGTKIYVTDTPGISPVSHEKRFDTFQDFRNYLSQNRRIQKESMQPVNEVLGTLLQMAIGHVVNKGVQKAIPAAQDAFKDVIAYEPTKDEAVTQMDKLAKLAFHPSAKGTPEGRLAFQRLVQVGQKHGIDHKEFLKNPKQFLDKKVDIGQTAKNVVNRTADLGQKAGLSPVRPSTWSDMKAAFKAGLGDEDPPSPGALVKKESEMNRMTQRVLAGESLEQVLDEEDFMAQVANNLSKVKDMAFSSGPLSRMANAFSGTSTTKPTTPAPTSGNTSAPNAGFGGKSMADLAKDAAARAGKGGTTATSGTAPKTESGISMPKMGTVAKASTMSKSLKTAASLKSSGTLATEMIDAVAAGRDPYRVLESR